MRMKKPFSGTTSDKSRGVTKGAPSGFVVSLIFHASVFFLAGLFVVFAAVKKSAPEFTTPPAIERPKMKLKKPKVKVKKSSQPKPSSRIVAKVKTREMPEIQLPDLMGSGEGLMGGLGGAGEFLELPDFNKLTLFGSGESIGSDLVGTFYDFKRDSSGRNISMTEIQMVNILRKFVRSGWDKSMLQRYYQSPKKLYTPCVMVPPIISSLAPAAFGEADTQGYNWMVHYEGKLVHKEGVKFRFWGHGDGLLVVRVNGEVVLNACWPGGVNDAESIAPDWISDSGLSRVYYLGNNKAAVGDWITLEPDVPLDMEVIIGDLSGGAFAAMMVVEVEGEDYETNVQGGPILPVFRTAPLSHEMVDAISEYLVEGEACVTNGPIFCDYTVSAGSIISTKQQESEPTERTALRLWTDLAGNSFKAEYLNNANDSVYLRDETGRERKVPLDQLSGEDREYVELVNPPSFNIDFIKLADTQMGRYQLSPREMEWKSRTPPTAIDYTFGAKVQQRGGGTYNHTLTVEYFALGSQISDSDKYMLLDHGTGTFVPSNENDRSFRFTGRPVEVLTFMFGNTSLLIGRKYAEYLVLLKDERGEVIGYSTSAKWLYENRENLRRIPVGAFMNRECNRVIPSGPEAILY